VDKHGEIIIYQTDDGLTSIEVKVQNETVCLTQQQMAKLFQISCANVVEHIKHIYEEEELNEDSTCRNFRQVRKEGNREVPREMLPNGDRMLLWTIQHKNAYETLLETGALRADEKYLFCEDDLLYVYQWISEQWKNVSDCRQQEYAIPSGHGINEYCIWGFHFFNQDNRMKEFDEEFRALTGKSACSYKPSLSMVAEDGPSYGNEE